MLRRNLLAASISAALAGENGVMWLLFDAENRIDAWREFGALDA